MNNFTKTLYNKCKNFVDSDFTIQNYDNNIEEQPDRNCELRFISFMIDNYNKDKLKHVSDKGLDLYLEDISRPVSNKNNGWAEFICPHHKQDVLQNPYKNEDDFLSRITLAIQTKNNKINSDIQKGLVKENEPVIVCVNLDQILDASRNDLLIIYGVEGCVPHILRTIYPVDETKAIINVTNPTKSRIEQNYKPYITKIKQNNKSTEIATDVFLNKEYKYISAVLFNYNGCGNSYILAHNYCAKNPIKRKMFTNCIEFVPNIFNVKTDKVFKLTKIDNHI